MNTSFSDSLLPKRAIFFKAVESSTYYRADDDSPHPVVLEDAAQAVQHSFRHGNDIIKKETTNAPQVVDIEAYLGEEAYEEAVVGLESATSTLNELKQNILEKVEQIQTALANVIGAEYEPSLNTLSSKIQLAVEDSSEDGEEADEENELTHEKSLQTLLAQLKEQVEQLSTAEGYLALARKNFGELMKSQLQTIASAVKRIELLESRSSDDEAVETTEEDVEALLSDLESLFEEGENQYHFEPQLLFSELNDPHGEVVGKLIQKIIREDKTTIEHTQDEIYQVLAHHKRFIEDESLSSKEALFRDSDQLIQTIDAIKKGMREDQKKLKSKKDQIEGNATDYDGPTIPGVQKQIRELSENGNSKDNGTRSTEAIDEAELTEVDQLLNDLKDILATSNDLIEINEAAKEAEKLVVDTVKAYEIKKNVFDAFTETFNEVIDKYLGAAQQTLVRLGEILPEVNEKELYTELLSSTKEAIDKTFDAENFKNNPQLHIDSFLSEVDLIQVMHDTLRFARAMFILCRDKIKDPEKALEIKDLIDKLKTERLVAEKYLTQIQEWFKEQMTSENFKKSLGALDEGQEKEVIESIQNIRQGFVHEVAATLMGIFTSEETVAEMRESLRGGGSANIKFSTKSGEAVVLNITGDGRNEEDKIEDYLMKTNGVSAEALDKEVTLQENNEGLIDSVLHFIDKYLDSKKKYQEDGCMVFVDYTKRKTNGTGPDASSLGRAASTAFDRTTLSSDDSGDES